MCTVPARRAANRSKILVSKRRRSELHLALRIRLGVRERKIRMDVRERIRKPANYRDGDVEICRLYSC